jgi:polyhydroxyalkanoate synthesis regulator phasin
MLPFYLLSRVVFNLILLPLFQPIAQFLYSPPHDPHLPSAVEALQTRVAIERRAAEVVSLKERISLLKEHVCQLQEKNLETLRPIMDHHHARICEIQQEMARLWTEYTARMTAAQEATETQVTTFQKRIAFLEKENSKSQSFLAPIRRLPTELLAEVLVIAIESHGRTALI